MIRCSSLPLARYCPGAAGLNRNDCDRVADVSSAWHALLGKQQDAEARLSRLTEEERAEVLGFPRPPPLLLAGLPPLNYENACHEVSVGLTAELRATGYDEGTLSKGTADAFWVVPRGEGKTLVLADLKFKRMNVLGGADSLQLKAYAIALADLHDCDQYVTALYGALEASWEVGSTVDVGSSAFTKDVLEVRSAAENTGDNLVRGTHCLNCYSRLRCSAWEFLEAGEMVSEPESGDQVVQLLLRARSYQDRADRIMDLAKAWVTAKGPVSDASTGKYYRMVECKGRKTLNEKAIEKVVGKERMHECYQEGRPYHQTKWTR